MVAPRRVKKYRKSYGIRMAVLATTFLAGVLIMIFSRYDVFPARPWGYVGLAFAAASAIIAVVSTVAEAHAESELESSPETARKIDRIDQEEAS